MATVESSKSSPQAMEGPTATPAMSTTDQPTTISITTTAATLSSGSPKGFQVTHTSYQHGTPPFHTTPPLVPQAALPGLGADSPSGSPLQCAQLPPSASRAAATLLRPQRRSSSSPSVHAQGETNTPPSSSRTTAVPLITPRYQKKSHTVRHMNVTDSFPGQQTPSGALRQEATERMTIQNGPMQYSQEVHFCTYDVYRHGKRQIHTRSVGYSSDGDLVMTREDYSEPSDVDNGFVRKRSEISEPTVLDPQARRPLTDKEVHSKHKIHLNRPRYKKYPGIRAPKNRKVRNRLLNDHFAHEMAREILKTARNWRKVKPEEPRAAVQPSFTDLPKSVLHAFDLEGEEQLQEFERLRIHPQVLAPQLRNVRAPPDPDSPEGRFQGLNTRLRGELQHALNSEFLTQQIEDLEVHFRDYTKGGATSPESLVFLFRDGYGRLICHGVASYYLLVSESRTVMDGSGAKLTYVSLPKTRRHGVRAVNLPHVPLLFVLKRNRRHLPARHSLSTRTTPHLAPVPAAGLGNDVLTKDAEAHEADVMPPLDLNAAAEPNGRDQPSNNRDLDGGGNVAEDPAAGTQPTQSGSGNPTVFRTVNNKLPTPDPLPFYIPMLRLTLTAQQQEDAAQQLDGASPVGSPDLGPSTFPLTATQQKKLRRADRLRSFEASQDDLPCFH
ncbi:hypothetical protein JKF63_01755 [Porcisia hertigi]|uniref:R3H-associated N-terminal domain-containing protein n=1 Tax=Porcisia hertigi TaxID=2761500 RepID=A0A836I5J2_9TRYP|nr:hypothetical protein JKF63_01755 [Porcisia hertigi]